MQQFRHRLRDGSSRSTLGDLTGRAFASLLGGSSSQYSLGCTLHAEAASNTAKTGTQQNLVKVLAAVLLRLDCGPLSLGLINAGLLQCSLDLFVDATLGRASTHASTDTSADGTHAQSASTQNLAAEHTKNGGSSSAKALRQQVNGSDRERLEASLDLIQDALVLCVLHDASNLLLVILGLGRHQAGQVTLYALDSLRSTRASAEGIGNHPDASCSATANA